MKSLNMLVMAAFAILSFSVFAQEGGEQKSTPNSKQQPQKTVYSCSMHPEVTSDKPGKCSKCGMDLKASTKTTTAYVCPMHPDVTSEKPGKCTKCGMDLVKAKEKTMAYVCPMHPDVTSDKPGKCSKCGMDLTKVKNKSKS